MEYDNDKLIKRPPKAEIFYWILLVFLKPVTDSLTTLPHACIYYWPALVLINALLFPIYLVYSRLMGQTLTIGSSQTGAIYNQTGPLHKWYPALISFLFFSSILLLLLSIYSLINSGDPIVKSYFEHSTHTLLRESWWTAITMALAVGIFFIRKAEDEKDQLAAAQQDNTFLRLRYLRSQLNPHFLFNTLNSIYSLSLQKSDQAPEVVIRLADIMRYLIYECNEEKIPLDKEIDFIRNYIEIEKVRHKADIRLTVDGDTRGLMIEPFLFISFIENGFKHAMDHSFDEPFIYITLRVGNGQIVLNVINSSAADLETQAKRVGGKGIAHSRSLLELLYPASYDLEIIATEKDENRTSQLRLRNARERLESLYPDSHTLDVILGKSAFTVSLILKTYTP